MLTPRSEPVHGINRVSRVGCSCVTSGLGNNPYTVHGEGRVNSRFVIDRFSLESLTWHRQHVTWLYVDGMMVFGIERINNGHGLSGKLVKTIDRLFQIFALFLAALLFAMLAACDGPPRPGPNGYIYFGSGSYLGKFSLRDGSSEIVAYVGDVNVTSVGNYKPSELLLTVRRRVNAKETQMIVRFEIANKHYTNLFIGDLAMFLPDREITVFDDGLALQSTRIVDNERKLTKIFPHDFDDLVTVVPTTGNRFFFQVAKGNVSRIFQYDAGSESLEAMDELSGLCDLDGAVWVSEMQRLLCRPPGLARADSEYRYVSPEGQLGAAMPRPAENLLRPLLYLPEQHVLVLTETWRGVFGGRQKYAVWIHELTTGDTYRLVEDQYLGSGVAYQLL